MTAIKTPGKYLSQTCIGGKRKGDMQEIVRSIFGESFLSIEIPGNERVFIIRIAIYNDMDVQKIKDFQANPKNKQCRIVTYKPIELSILLGVKKK